MKIRIILIGLLVWTANLLGQNYLDVLRPFQGMQGRSGAESGITPAAMATSNALLGNPALLSYTERAFVAADLNFDQVTGTSIFDAARGTSTVDRGLSFNSLTYIHPVHVYRGAWVWGFNLQPLNSFSRINQFGDLEPDQDFHYQYTQQETGALYALTAGTSLLATMNTSLGLAVSFLVGENAFSKVYQETDPDDVYTFDRFIDSLRFTPQYRGVSARLGLLAELSETLRLGASLEFPARISVTESSSRDSIEWFDDGWENDISHETWSALEYTVWGPWRLGAGLGFIASPLEASVNYRFHSYRSSSFSGDLFDPDGGGSLENQIAEQISDHVQNVHEISASLLWAMAPLNLSFGASVMNSPLNYRFENNLRLDIGIGYQMRSGLGFTLALRNEEWQSDLNHTLESGVDRSVAVENNYTKFQFGIKYIL